MNESSTFREEDDTEAEDSIRNLTITDNDASSEAAGLCLSSCSADGEAMRVPFSQTYYSQPYDSPLTGKSLQPLPTLQVLCVTTAIVKYTSSQSISK